MRHAPGALMLFAAGFGSRMGALTAHRPKPLIPVAGKPMIDRALALADQAGIGRKVVNLHYLGEQIERHLSGQPDIALSWEREQILETGGGLRAALPLLGDGPVFTLNPDVIWTGENPLLQLATAWDGAKMDALLMLLPLDRVAQPNDPADFALAGDGRIKRAGTTGRHRYLGAQIIRTEALADIPEKAFSLNLLWDRMIAQGRAFGLVHSGGWCDVGTPEGLAQAEAMLAAADV